MSRNRNVWVIAGRHQDGVTIANHGHKFGILSIVVHQLNAEREDGQVDGFVNFMAFI